MALLTMVSMGAEAKIDVQIGKFTGGTIEEKSQTEPDEKGFVTVTITVTPNKEKGYTIKKGDISVYSTLSPSGPSAGTRALEIADNLTLYFKGSADADTDDPSAEREYTFNVPSGFGAWVKEAEFQSSGKKEPTRAINYKYVIINNKGNEAFNYTIQGDVNYSSINKAQLCVHPKAKSVLATNFRFYTTEAAAVADASSGVTGAAGIDYYTEGTTISDITNVRENTFYVRYSLKDNPAIDINAEKVYKLQVRQRNGTWYYVVYDGSANTIKMKTAEGTSNSYLWKLDSGDPYDMYILNLQGLADNANGVFTVPSVVNTGDKNGESALSAIYYRNKITTDYNQSASSMNLQSFILTQGSDVGFNYENGWKNVWSNSFHIIGAYNGIENKPKDTEGSGSNYATPLYMAYYVCANTADNNKPLQFYRNWRVEDTKSTNVSQIKFTEVKQTYTFHIINNSGVEAVCASTTSELNVGTTITASMIPDIIKSPLADNYTFYSTAADAAAGDNPITVLPYPSNDVYVRYTTNGGSLDINGGINYYMATNDNYLYASSASAIGIESPITETGNSRKWKITGNDAYQLTLQNADNSNYVTYNVSSGEAVPTLSASGSKFFLHQSTEGKYELVATTNNDFSTTNYYTLGVANSTLKLYSKTNYPLGVDAVQTFFSDQEPCASPVISFNNSNGQVTLSSATEGTTIYYTTDGTTPSTSSLNYSTTGAFILSATTTIKAIAVKDGYANSAVTEKTIAKLDAPTVTFDDASQSVTITTNSTVEEVSTVYTDDENDDPTPSSTAYTAAISLTATTTVKAMTVKDQYINSDIVSLTVTKLNDPTITHNQETRTITITGGEGETLLYTTDGSDPDHNHVGGDNPTKQYTDAFNLDDGNKYDIKVIATKNGSLNSSVVEEMIDYRSVVTPPTIIFLGNTVTITADIGDVIYYTYTTNGDEPVDATDASQNYGTTSVTINLGEGVTICKVKAIAKYSDKVSVMTSEIFDLTGANLSGYYYLQSNGDKAYFMCPSATTKEEGKPYVQTDKSQAIKAVWKLEKISTDTYRIKHYNNNQYLVATTTKDEITNSVWLETTASPGDNTLFEITETSEGSGIYMIKPKAAANTDGKNYLNVSGGNKDNHTIGLWTAGNNDNNSKWLLLKVPASPTFSVSDIKVTLKAPLGDIYYKVNNVTQNGDITPDNYDDATKGSSVTLKYGPSYKVWSIAKYKYQSDPDKYWVSDAVSQAVQVALLNPIFSSSGDGVTISNSQASGVTFRYTFSNDGSEPVDPVAPSGAGTDYASVLPLTANARNIFKAIAYNTVDGETYSSDVVTFVVDLRGAEVITSFAGITSITGNYKFSETSFSATGTPKVGGAEDGVVIGTAENPFKGTIDGNFVEIALGNNPLFACVEDAIIKNVIVSSVSISGGTNAGAIANEAKGASRIYNCGVKSGSVSGSGDVGSIIGKLSGSSRVINCYSFANITGGNIKGGIVGNNTYASTSTDIRTMVMNCMFYGDISSGGNISPVFGGTLIDNLKGGGLNTYNYYRYQSDYSYRNRINKYNNSLAAKEEYLNRFEFYRQLLNSNKKLAALYATGSADNAEEKMAKWVLETADRSINTPMLYPILKKQGKYPSIINYDTNNLSNYDEDHRNEGRQTGTLSVTINYPNNGWANAPTGAKLLDINGNETTSSRTISLVRTDKDYAHYNFNYDKVQLPYYNDYGTKNYTGNKVVTGWKITGFTNGTAGTYTAADQWNGYNFADRNCTNKDLYGTNGSNRVFSQGAYFDVPYGVTAITIEPYWGNAAYISDGAYDVVYDSGYGNAENVSGLGTQYTNKQTEYNNDANQKVYTSIADALGSISGATVYDNALVLVGNRHMSSVPAPSSGTKPFTIMSVDMDHDNEPDYSLIYHHSGRATISPIRFDFLNIMGTAQAQKPNGATKFLNVGIFKPKGWFELTNTSMAYFSQIEYDNGGTKAAEPLILLGGVVDQITSNHEPSPSKTTTYIHVGGNVWFKQFNNGCHSDRSDFTKHIPISVTGGDYDAFYLSGIYKPDADVDADNAECYISGGRFRELAGAGQQQINGDVQWQIYNADIENFYGGGINAAKPITGKITTNIYNSHITTFCGGPKFGNMQTDKKVETEANGCVFGTYYGAGYGGTSYNTVRTQDKSTVDFPSWESDYTTPRGKYSSGNKGIATDFDYEFFVWSSGETGGRFYVKYASLSTAQTNNVTSTLTNCVVNGNVYGGGKLGRVAGKAKTTLDGCTVNGDVFGAGYSGTLDPVKVRDAGFGAVNEGDPIKYPSVNTDSGMFEDGEFSGTTDYFWKQHALTDNASNIKTEDGVNYIYTDVDLTVLGQVDNAELIIQGSTTNITGNVYGGGEEANVNGNTTTNISGGTVEGNVYGGGNLGSIGTFTISNDMRTFTWTDSEGNTNTTANTNNKNTGVCNVTITDGTINGNVFGAGKGKGDTFWCEKAIAYSTDVSITAGTVNGNVYGGGEVGRVETNTVVKIGNGAGTQGESIAPNITGSVFGGGAGLETHGYSALVRGNTSVTVEGNASVGHSVYGGGEVASVGKYGLDTQDMPSILKGGGYCFVTVQGYARVGEDIYGACKGVTSAYNNQGNANRSKRMVVYAPTREKKPHTNANKGTFWDPYPDNNENPTFVWEYFETPEEYSTYLETLALATHPEVTISGNAAIGRSVFGGGEMGLTKGSVIVNIQGGTVTEDVYGGGALANTNTTTTADLNDDGDLEDVTPTTTVNLTGGTIGGDAFGGGLGQIGVGASPAVYYTEEEATAYNTEHGLSEGDEGYVTTETVKTPAVAGVDAIPATVYGDITVNLGVSGGSTATAFHITNYGSPHADVVKSGRVFGCNNLYGSPQGNVTVNVWKTVAGKLNGSTNSRTAEDPNNPGRPPKNVTSTYEVAALYGGGNLADYTATGKKAKVVIEKCDVSIREVYGGGNAAAVPETEVQVKGAYEIETVFGGGNGKDPYTLDGGSNWINNSGANVNGDTNTMLTGGTIHEAYGGSNKRGKISGKVRINTGSGGDCKLDCKKVVAAGKDADLDTDAILVMGCVDGEKIDQVIGGANNANVNGNIWLTITSGEFGRVFGGNNDGGIIKGSIRLNIEETSCTPIKIDELYLGGNEATYSIYGYYKDSEGKWQPRTSNEDSHVPVPVHDEDPAYNDTDNKFTPYAEPVLNIISCTSIGKVFGGGKGAGAAMYANPTVNINMRPGKHALEQLNGVDKLGTIQEVFGGGNEAVVYGNTTVNIGTSTTVEGLDLDETSGDPQYDSDGITPLMTLKAVEGANITGNVYGGGNLADVTGNTFVNICAKKSESGDDYEAVAEGTSGVTIGGTVFGGGKGKEDTFLCEKAMIGENGLGADNPSYPNGNTSVRIGHGTVMGSVYGGGEVGRVEMNTVVEIGYGDGGSQTKSPIIEGNVFGAGKGVKTHGYSALVRGNPHVTIQGDTWVKKSVYGGGEIASVARYRVAQTDAEGAPYGVEKGEPYLLANSNSGYCYVTVKGNAEIGTSGMKMYHNGSADDKPDDWGHVFAAGKGVLPETYDFANYSADGSNRTNYPKRMMLYDSDKYPNDKENKTWEYVDPVNKETNKNIWEYFNTEEKYFTFVKTLGLATQTYVYIGDDASGATDNPLIYGSVYGGSENGIVQFDTDVYIKSGQIGCGDGATGRYSSWPIDDESFETSWKECASWVYGLDTDNDTKKDLFAPYDPNANASGDLDKYPKVDAQSTAQSTQGGRRVATDGHTYYGNVFGGGSGSVPYFDNLQGISRYIISAGQVRGNTNVTITGGHILTNVYGGCEATDVDGTATVKMTGGTIGVPRTDDDIINHPVTGYLFGGGKGDQRVFFNKDTNVKDAVVTVEGGRIYGSVYGGGEDGHVLRNTTVTIGKSGNTGPKIGTSGTSYYDGHVFGGGRGFGGEALTAGNVGGAVTLNVLGGDILGSVYGGGRLASVGYGLYLTTETGYGIMRADDEYDGSYTNPSTEDAGDFFTLGRGHIIMNISGGTIGNSKEYDYDANNTLTHTKGGNVFAGGMGRLYKLDGTYNSSVDWRKMGCVKSTKLTISGSAVIKSCVYGGGELGQVVGTQKGSETKGAEIIIKDGTIGTEIKDGGVTQYTFGSVFGGGYGSDVEDITVTVDNVETVTKPKLEAGLVKYDTNVDMQGGTVKASIYGGGEMASVGSVTEGESPTVTGSSYVTVSDGFVGIDRVALDGGGYKYFGGATMGNVFGGGSGLRTVVRSGRIMKNATVNITGGRIYHNVYGGGAFGTVGDFNYTEDNTANKKVTGINGLKTTGTGVATVTITGGTLGTSGRENGMVFGSSRGEVGQERDDWLAWTYDTHVTIGDDGAGPQIHGSVYGGGENGHTWNDAEVIIHSGTIGITSGEKITMDGIEYDGARFPNRGNVYGGGCGTDDYTLDENNDENPDDKDGDGKPEKYYNPLAGVVYGKATVTMDGGHVVHNVYGAGAMGSVGRFTFDTDKTNKIPDGKPVGLVEGSTSDSGHCYITVSGGKIGMTNMTMKGTANGEPDNFGHVFGAGRGEVKDTTVYVNIPVVGYIKESHVEISGSAFVTGSVYGGGESGHVLGDTSVDIKGGQIGCGDGETAAFTTWENQTSMAECAHWDWDSGDNGVPYDKFSGTEGYSSNASTTATDGHTFYGNVFGGGSGYYPYAAGKWVRSAGLVEGNTTVTISGGHILSSVYGGNEQTDVYGSCTVTMTDGTVGVPRTYDERLVHPVTGNLFGAGKGDKRTLFNTWTNVGSTKVSVSGGTVYGSVFGGGEDGHVLGDAETTISGDDTVIGTLGTTGYEGNVFGGGRGSFTALTAGVVGGNVALNIQGGKILGSVYGGGRLASVGTFFANPKLEDGTTDNPLYGTMQPGDAHGNIRVNISGNSTVIGAVDNGKVKNSLNSIGEVYGGCKGTTDGNLKDKLGVAKSTIVNLLGGTVGNSIYGGGEVGNVGDLGEGDAAAKAFAKVNLLGGSVVNVYGGGLGKKTSTIDARALVKGDVTVNLNGLETADYDTNIFPATISDIVDGLNEDGVDGIDFYRVKARANGCKVTGNIFGCNNVNGTPTGHAKVHVFMTTPTVSTPTADDYDISAIYGGGNQADYEPASTDTQQKTEVIIEGCDLTKIQQVYGGGNAAATPGTLVLIKGTELIDEVFGGGNGVSTETFTNPGANVGFHTDKTTYSVGDGKTYVQLMAGKVNNVYGGSNSNGDIRAGSSITRPTPDWSDGVTSCCKNLTVNGTVFGGGKNANMKSGAEIVLGCMPTDWIAEIYAGAEMANVKGNVSLTLTSGKFGRVFGGNKTSGILDGSITVNIEENGSCDVPLVIGELYGGGNMAAYSIYGYNGDEPRTKAQWDALTSEQKEESPVHASPVVNVHGFTSIGNIYGGGYGADADMYGSPTVNINEVMVVGNKAYQFANDNSLNKPTTLIDGVNVKLYDHDKDKMGVIGNVFGGGNAALVDGNTTVNIATEENVYVVKLVDVDDPVNGLYKRVKNETTGEVTYTLQGANDKAVEGSNYYQLLQVQGADIRGNVYGGGNKAEVTGNTNVNIGKQSATSVTP